MTKSTTEIIAILDSISNVTTDADQLNKLAVAVESIAAADEPLLTVEPLLHIFERFPESDGFGVFWSILHKIETIPGYEPFLLSSVRRTPSEFTITMINRLINDKRNTIADSDLISLLTDIEANTNYSEKIRKIARGYIEYQNKNA